MAYPQTGWPVTEFLINGTWADVSSYVRQGDGTGGISITRGRANEQGRVGPSSSRFDLNNRDGRFSNRNPTGTYYGLLPRNTQVRHSAGTGDNYLRYPGDYSNSNTNVTYTPDAAALDIVGDMEVRVDVLPHNWRPMNGLMLASKYQLVANQRSWVFYLNSNGTLTLIWSTDGTSTNRVFATSTVVVPASTGRLSLKVTLDVDNGAAGNTVKFFTASTIGGTYTQLGASVTTAGVTSIFSSTARLAIGSGDDTGTPISGVDAFRGRFYGLALYNGIAGTQVAGPDFSTVTAGAASFSDTFRTWTVGGTTRVTTDRYRFWGELASLPQSWDKAAIDNYMPVEGAGLIRRLSQSGSPLRSAMYRQFTQLSGVVGYWPFEDGVNSADAANALTGGPVARTDAVTFAAEDTLAGSDTSLTFSSTSGSIVAVPKGTASVTGTLSFMVWMKLPAFPATQKTLITLYTTGTARRYEIGLDASNWRIDAYDTTNASLYSTTTVASTISPVNQWIGVNLLLETSGANVNVSARWLKVDGSSTFAGIGPTAFAGTVGKFTQANIKAGGEANYNGADFAHLLLSNADINFVSSTVYNAANAYLGERAATRIARLAAEEGITVEVDGYAGYSAVMGTQGTNTFIELLYECADSDMGLLTETRNALALSYRTQWDLGVHRDVTLSMTSSHLSDAPLPTEDDAFLVNDQTVQVSGGSSARYVKSSGALSTAAPPSGVGTYDSSVTLSLAESALYNAAGWLVHMGTWDEARYPNLSVGLHRSQIGTGTLAEQVRALDVGSTALLANLPSWMPPDSVPLLIQGYSETLRKTLWDVTFNTSPAGPYNTARYDISDVIGTPRYDTSGSTLNAGITSSATALALAYSNTGDNWTTTSGSYPFDIMVGGERITLTGPPGGSTSPQSFTGVTRSVNGVVKAHNAAEKVTLADTRYYAR